MDCRFARWTDGSRGGVALSSSRPKLAASAGAQRADGVLRWG
ncbi:hypothetical protein [Niveibacterium microcysteis]|nr:hypothetical protein [Niveibacterium microcysteis]